VAAYPRPHHRLRRLPRHPLHLAHIDAHTLGHAPAALRIHPVEHRALLQADALLRLPKAVDNVADKVVAVLGGHHVAG